MWAGEDRFLLDRANQVHVVHSVAFGYEDIDVCQAVALGKAEGRLLRAQRPPHGGRLRREVAGAGRRKAATSAATGMAANSNALLAESVHLT